MLALGIAIYTGFLLGVVRAYPLWNNAALPILFLISALSTGVAATIILGFVFDPSSVHGMFCLKKIHAGLIVAEACVLVIMLLILNASGGAAAATVHSIAFGNFAVAFWLGVVVIGLVAPFCLQAMALFSKKAAEGDASGKGAVRDLVAELGVLVGGFMLRLIVVTAALPVVIL